MHPAAYHWVEAHVVPGRVLEIGSRDVNGSVRKLFWGEYVGLDITDGTGVDVVADVCDYQPAKPFDVVVCCEVLEHTDAPIIDAAHRLLRDGGTLIFTAAGPGREPHSAVDGGPVRGGEFYRNVEPDDLELTFKGWTSYEVDVLGDDIRAVAVK